MSKSEEFRPPRILIKRSQTGERTEVVLQVAWIMEIAAEADVLIKTARQDTQGQSRSFWTSYLRAYRGEVFAIDLVCTLVLREIGVLITAIMVADRSGSAIVG